jgi:hypothetical protein
MYCIYRSYLPLGEPLISLPPIRDGMSEPGGEETRDNHLEEVGVRSDVERCESLIGDGGV